jgi:hypothetical protein
MYYQLAIAYPQTAIPAERFAIALPHPKKAIAPSIPKLSLGWQFDERLSNNFSVFSYLFFP